MEREIQDPTSSTHHSSKDASISFIVSAASFKGQLAAAMETHQYKFITISSDYVCKNKQKICNT